jgi:hypothetical protein
MNNKFPERNLLARLESGQQGIYDVRQVVCRPKLHAQWEDVEDVEPG